MVDVEHEKATGLGFHIGTTAREIGLPRYDRQLLLQVAPHILVGLVLDVVHEVHQPLGVAHLDEFFICQFLALRGSDTVEITKLHTVAFIIA